MNTKDYAERV